jgi:steroid delta-isomerase-like uncharacterized protein
MSDEANVSLVRRFFEEVLNKTDMKVAEAILAPNFVMYYPTTPEPLHGVEGLKQVHLSYVAGFPDWQFRIEEEIPAGEKVVVRWSGSGTQSGELMGIPPTGKRVNLTGISIFRLAGGRITEDRVEANALRMMQQLGVIPSG